MSDAGGTGDPTETLEMEQSHSPQASRQLTREAIIWNPEGKGEQDDRATRGAAIGKQVSNKRDTAGDNWRGWLGISMPGGTMLAVDAPGWATNTLID